MGLLSLQLGLRSGKRGEVSSNRWDVGYLRLRLSEREVVLFSDLVV